MTSPDATPGKTKRFRPGRILAVVLLAPLLLVTAYTLFVLNWSYSDGERVGYLQKFSRKGWLCKTWEGEVVLATVPGSMPEKWSFTVRRASVVEAMNSAVGKRVQLHYTEHRGIPTSCFGDTNYFVDAVTVVDEAGRPVDTSEPAR